MLIRDQAGRTARIALYSGIVWLVVSLTTGLLALLAAGRILPGIVSPQVGDLLGVHQLQPIFLNTFIFGWAAMAGTSLGLFIIERNHGVAISNEVLGQFSIWLWNVANAGGAGALLLGLSSSGPFAGYMWPMQVVWLLGLLLLLFNVARTINAVAEPLYASTWYLLAALAWGGALYFAGNGLWLVPYGFGVNPVAALFQSMYAQGVIWLWAVPLAAGAALYAAPVVAGRPLYSRRLAHLGLWGLALHAGTGVQRLWGASVPEWAQATSIGAGALTIVATLALIVNLNKTIGDGEQARTVAATPAGRLLRIGIVLFFIAGLQAVLQPLTIVQQYVHGTQWAVAQHLTALLAATMFLFAGVYELLPMLRRPKDRTTAVLYTDRGSWWHVTLSGLGAGLFIVGLWLGGTLQVLARLSSGPAVDLAHAAGPGLPVQAAGIGVLLVGQAFLAVTVVRAALARQPIKLPVIITNPGTES